MALTTVSLYSSSTSPSMLFVAPSSSASACASSLTGRIPRWPPSSPPALLPSITSRPTFVTRSRRSLHVVRMAPDEQRQTRRSPLDFPVEWERARPGRRPDILPQFSPMKTPLPPPLPTDPPFPEEEEEKDPEEEEQRDPEEEEEEEDENAENE